MWKQSKMANTDLIQETSYLQKLPRILKGEGPFFPKVICLVFEEEEITQGDGDHSLTMVRYR